MLLLAVQHSYFSGMYSVILTKVAFLHRDYVMGYKHAIPPPVNKYIDEKKNCEDLAMAYAILAKVCCIENSLLHVLLM